MSAKISLAGDLGSGKSTVSSILTEALCAEYYSTGRIVREIAERMGMTALELNRYMETHPEIDTEIDNGLCALSDDPRSLIIDSRMAWHFVRGTFKVYMTTDAEVSALRIMYANRQGEHNDTLEATVAATRERRESERKRYLEQYGTDITDLMNYDYVVDTTVASPEEVAAAIISAFSEWQTDPTFGRADISPERLSFPDDEPDSDKLMEYSDRLEMGESLPTVTAFYDNGEFCVSGEVEAALAYSLAMEAFVPTKLVSGSRNGANFVRMKNSL